MTQADFHLFKVCQEQIGKPWVSGARGPESFDCWGLLVYLYHQLHGIVLPQYPNIDAKDTLRVSRLINAGTASWTKLDAPQEFCAVGMSANKVVSHVGIWVNNGILHASEKSGVVFQKIPSVKGTGLSNITFYQHRS